jgi:hypothetical protein
MRAQFEQAGREEEDHLAWTAERLSELGSQPSLLNPLWYAGAYALGTVAARMGDARSLGFVVETERQVEAHLNSHLDKLPPQDAKSRAIVEQMRVDEIAHGAAAQAMGAAEMPLPVRAWRCGDVEGDDHHRLLHLSYIDDFERVRDLGRLGQHDRGRAVLVVRQADGALHRRRLQVAAADDEVEVDLGEHLRIGVGALGLQV